MSIFGKKNKQLEPLQNLIGDTLGKVIDLCVKFDLLCDKIEKMDDRLTAVESIMHRVSASMTNVESKLSVRFEPLIELAEKAVEIDAEKQAAVTAKNREEFYKSVKKLSDEEKEMLSTRLLFLLKRDAENLNLPAEIDGGISSDFDKMYNELRVKHGLKPVSTLPSSQTPWREIEKTESKEEKKEDKKPKAKKGKKNGKKPGRNRKAKAAGSGDAVSTDKKLADGQG